MKTILLDAKYCFIAEQEGKFGVFLDMYDLLETYPNRKIILTNANDEQAKLIGLDDVPYEVFSLKHNPDKINPEYYKIMLEKFNLNKDDVLYFEHDIDVVKSAQSVGINTYHYDSNKKDLESLKSFLDENLK
jgi:FMN phosphatase YigB (HAD superfamily)